MTDSFDTCFTGVKYILCDMKDNIKSKLFKLEIHVDVSKSYIEDIFGIQIGHVKKARAG